MMVAPVLAAVLDAQNVSRLCGWLSRCYVEEKSYISVRGGL